MHSVDTRQSVDEAPDTVEVPCVWCHKTTTDPRGDGWRRFLLHGVGDTKYTCDPCYSGQYIMTLRQCRWLDWSE